MQELLQSHAASADATAHSLRASGRKICADRAGRRPRRCRGCGCRGSRMAQDSTKGVQWKQGVVIYIMSCTVSLHDATPIHCTPLPLHPPLLNTQWRPRLQSARAFPCDLRAGCMRATRSSSVSRPSVCRPVLLSRLYRQSARLCAILICRSAARCACVCLRACVRVCARVCVGVRVCACVCTCVCMCVYMCVCV